MGFVGYYRRFCSDFATIARPLNVLSSKETKFQWGVPEETAFQQLKTLLIETPVLTYPDPLSTVHFGYRCQQRGCRRGTVADGGG